MAAIFGWFSDANTCASRVNRARRSGSATNESWRTLMATSRLSLVSVARTRRPCRPRRAWRQSGSGRWWIADSFCVFRFADRRWPVEHDFERRVGGFALGGENPPKKAAPRGREGKAQRRHLQKGGGGSRAPGAPPGAPP